jgi:ribosomal-protein-alanine N-acetyltransferase
MRLERGGYDFLASATEAVARLAGASVYSPALYPSSTRVWHKAGYEPVDELEIMEHSVSTPWGEPTRSIAEAATPDWARIQEIDDAAFEGFWKMSLAGLREALSSTRRNAILEARHEGVLVGYAIVGAQWDVSYLQRIAVEPDRGGQSFGSDLVRAALGWGLKERTRVMVLNVRSSNERAQHLYIKEGFIRANTKLHLLRYQGAPVP